MSETYKGMLYALGLVALLALSSLGYRQYSLTRDLAKVVNSQCGAIQDTTIQIIQKKAVDDYKAELDRLTVEQAKKLEPTK